MLLHEKVKQIQKDTKVEAEKKIEAQPISVQPMAEGPAQDLPPPGSEEGLEELVEEEGPKESKLLDLLNELLPMVKEILEKEHEEHSEESPIDELKEDKEEELDEDVTPDEFGVNVEEQLASKESKKEDEEDEEEESEEDEEDEKEEKTAASDLKPSETLDEEFNKAKSDSTQYKQNVSTPQITKVKEDALPEMFKLADLVLEFDESKCQLKNANDETVALYEMDTDKVTDSERQQFAKDFVDHAVNNGIEATLQRFNAKKVDSLKEKDTKKVKEMTKLNDEIPADTMFDVKKIAEDEYKIKHRRAQKLVWTAMNKNLLGEGNPIKAALMNKFVDDLKIDAKQAAEAIELAFAGAADEYFDLQASKVDQFLSMNDEAFLQVESTFAGTNIRIPEMTIDASSLTHEEVNPQQKAKDMRIRAARGSLPLSTQTNSNPEAEYRSRIADAMPKPQNFGNALKIRK